MAALLTAAAGCGSGTSAEVGSSGGLVERVGRWNIVFAERGPDGADYVVFRAEGTDDGVCVGVRRQRAGTSERSTPQTEGCSPVPSIDGSHGADALYDYGALTPELSESTHAGSFGVVAAGVRQVRVERRDGPTSIVTPRRGIYVAFGDVSAVEAVRNGTVVGRADVD
jgi:hypothetical protein